jgi:hypothetical protein
MTPDQLIAEGQRLARPCVYLRTLGGELAGVWGGEGIAPPSDDGPYRHWLSISTRFVPGYAGRAGCLSVYTNEDDCETGIVVEDEHIELPEFAEGIPLYAEGIPLDAERALSLPPIDAIFRFGSAAVEPWLAKNCWERDCEYNDNFPDSATVSQYERHWQDQLPFYDGTAHAVLGGWHSPWPDGDWEELVDQQLIVWTFADSESWVEAWKDASGYRVIQRIT